MDSYIDDILDGFGTRPTGPIPEGLLGHYSKEDGGPQYNLTRAWPSNISRMLGAGIQVSS